MSTDVFILSTVLIVNTFIVIALIGRFLVSEVKIERTLRREAELRLAEMHDQLRLEAAHSEYQTDNNAVLVSEINHSSEEIGVLRKDLKNTEIELGFAEVRIEDLEAAARDLLGNKHLSPDQIIGELRRLKDANKALRETNRDVQQKYKVAVGELYKAFDAQSKGTL